METEIYASTATATVIQLPELMCRILSFLPRPDLLSCTRVSSLWESEARQHLLKKYPTTPLCCSQVSQYFSTMAVRGFSHTHLKLSTCSSSDCLSLLVAKLMEENRLQSVTTLVTDWTVDRETGIDFLLWPVLSNLSTLELRPTRRRDGTDLGITELLSYFQYPAAYFLRKSIARGEGLLTFPSITTLVWHLPRLFRQNIYSWIQPIRSLIGAAGLTMFPNVGSLRFKFCEKRVPKRMWHFSAISKNGDVGQISVMQITDWCMGDAEALYESGLEKKGWRGGFVSCGWNCRYVVGSDREWALKLFLNKFQDNSGMFVVCDLWGKRGSSSFQLFCILNNEEAH